MQIAHDNMLFRVSLVTACLLLSFCSVFAQDNNRLVGRSPKRSLSLTAGSYWLDIGDLNNELEKNGYVKLPDRVFSIGTIGFDRLNESLWYAAEGNILLGKETNYNGFRSSLLSGYAMAEIGYFADYKEVNFYPFLGVGGGWNRLKITDSMSYSFDELLATPFKEVNTKNSFLILGLGIGLEHGFFSNRNGQVDGLIIGLRGGYNFTPLVSDWKIDGNTLKGGPDTGIAGYYIRMTIGYGKY